MTKMGASVIRQYDMDQKRESTRLYALPKGKERGEKRQNNQNPTIWVVFRWVFWWCFFIVVVFLCVFGFGGVF